MAAPPPPPPYDSVIADNAGSFFTSAPSVHQAADPAASRSSQFEITVSDPVKHGEGMSAYVTYKINTKTSHPSYSRPTSDVTRRYSEFVWLFHQLAERHKGVIMPPLPEKSTVQKFQMSTEFIDQRRRALQDFAIEMARWQAQSAASKPPAVNGALQWLKSLGHTASNMVSGRSDDSLEDAEYIKVRDYINALETHLNEAHRQAARLVKKEADLASALADFGTAAEQLGKLDDGPVRGAMDVLCARGGQIASAARTRADELANDFEAPLKEAARTVKSVQAAMLERANALSQYCQAKSELDSRKVKLAKIRGTPGLKEQKISEAETEVSEAEQRVQHTKIAYDEIVSCMTEELNRFQKQRAADMRSLLQDFALAQARAAAENARAWNALLQDIQQQGQQQTAA